jgi:hypothetical protein
MQFEHGGPAVVRWSHKEPGTDRPCSSQTEPQFNRAARTMHTTAIHFKLSSTATDETKRSISHSNKTTRPTTTMAAPATTIADVDSSNSSGSLQELHQPTDRTQAAVPSNADPPYAPPAPQHYYPRHSMIGWRRRVLVECLCFVNKAGEVSVEVKLD